MKKFTKVALVTSAAAMAVSLAACGGGDAEFPSDNIEILVPYGAGGATDTTARSFAVALERELGVQVLVVNRDGGASAIGTTEAARQDPDGYHTFIAPGSTFSTVPLLQEVQYSSEDFLSIQPIADQPYVIVSAVESSYKTIEDVAAAPSRVTYTTFGNGHLTHLLMANTLDAMGVTGEAVPYTSASDALQAVTSGQVDFGVIDINISGPAITQGTVNPLAVSSVERHSAFPDVPSLAETDWPAGAGYISTLAWSVPADTPQEIVDVLTEAGKAAFASDSYSEYMANNYIEPSQYEGNDWFTVFMPELSERAAEDFARLGLSN